MIRKTDNEKNSATKMTDNEIIKAFTCCCVYGACTGCPLRSKDCSDIDVNELAINLINRQKAENEELISKLDELESEYTFYKISAQEQIEALIAGQETLQKALAEKIADNERLKKLLDDEEKKFKLCAKRYYELGVKEFAERLKDRPRKNLLLRPDSYYKQYVRVTDIDNLVKEMVGETE